MIEQIKQQNISTEFFTSEQCFISEISNSADDPDVSIARARVEPGVTTRWHRLAETTERYCIISGKGCVEIGELPETDVAAGDVVLIPPMCRQRMTNTGTEDLIFLAICSPRFRAENYIEINEVEDFGTENR